jgi:hypothetical protein
MTSRPIPNADAVYELYVAAAPDGRKYVGCTSKTVAERWRSHSPWRSQGHAFGHALHAIGKDSFTVEHIASSIGAANAVAAEALLIHQYNSLSPNGFNLSAHGPLRGSASRPKPQPEVSA